MPGQPNTHAQRVSPSPDRVTFQVVLALTLPSSPVVVSVVEATDSVSQRLPLDSSR